MRDEKNFERVLCGLENVNLQVGSEQETALSDACFYGNMASVRRLLEDPDIDVNLPTVIRNTPLMIAAFHERTEIVTLLLRDPRVLVNEHDSGGHTALWLAVFTGGPDMVRVMVASGRDLELAHLGYYGGEKCTALELASTRDNMAAGRLLEMLARDPQSARYHAKLELRWHDVLAAELFAAVIFFCDGFLALQQHYIGERDLSLFLFGYVVRFLLMTARLPLELQMLICNRALESPKTIIRTAHSEPAFHALCQHFK